MFKVGSKSRSPSNDSAQGVEMMPTTTRISPAASTSTSPRASLFVTFDDLSTPPNDAEAAKAKKEELAERKKSQRWSTHMTLQEDQKTASVLLLQSSAVLCKRGLWGFTKNQPVILRLGDNGLVTAHHPDSDQQLVSVDFSAKRGAGAAVLLGDACPAEAPWSLGTPVAHRMQLISAAAWPAAGDPVTLELSAADTAVVWAGTLAAMQRKLDRAHELFTLNIELKRAAHGPDALAVSEAISQLAAIEVLRGDPPTQPLAHYAESLRLKRAKLGDTDPALLTTYLAMGNIGTVMQDHVLALTNLSAALAIQVSNGDADELETASTYWSLAGAHAGLGQYRESLECLDKCLAIQRSALGEKSPIVAMTYWGMAGVYAPQGKQPEALACMAKCLEIRRATLGESHPDTVLAQWSLTNATASVPEGKYPEVVRFFRKNLAVKRASLGELHADTAAALKGLANVFMQQGDWSEALECLETCLAADLAAPLRGEHHVDTAITRLQLAQVQWREKKFDLAEVLFEKARPVLERAYGPDHPSMQVCLKGLRRAEKRRSSAEAEAAASALHGLTLASASNAGAGADAGAGASNA